MTKVRSYFAFDNMYIWHISRKEKGKKVEGVEKKIKEEYKEKGGENGGKFLNWGDVDE